MEVIGSKHSAGNFILRWFGDKISIFLEIAIRQDMDVKKLKNKRAQKYTNDLPKKRENGGANSMTI